MPFLIILAALVFILLVYVVAGPGLSKFFSEKKPALKFSPYVKNPVLFSPAERSLLGVLYQAFGSDYQIFGKVRVADVVSVKPLSNRSDWQSAFNKINAKHFDFVLCSKTDLSIVAVLELNDSSHEEAKRSERDSFLEALCQSASLPLVQIKAEQLYSVSELKTAVGEAIQKSEIASSPSEEELIPSKDAPKCPKCMAPMLLKKSKSGVNKGSEFWGCSQYPKCRTLIPKEKSP